MSAKTFNVAVSPHLKAKDTVQAGMWDVVIAMLPALAVALYAYKQNALLVIVVAVLACLVSQVVIGGVMGRGFSADGSVVVTGLILALCFSPGASPLLIAISAFAAIGIAKELMGGIGYNLFNPAAFGKSVGIICGWLLAPILAGVSMGWNNPMPDALSGATPLAAFQYAAVVGGAAQAQAINLVIPDAAALFLYNPGGGALVEVSALAVIVGALWLLIKRRINLVLPVAIIVPVLVLSLIVAPQYAIAYTLAGGLFFGAFFMATDWVTAPITASGQIIYGLIIGVCIAVFRLFLPMTGGVVFSILIGNALTPLIDKLTKKRVFGAA